MTAREAAGREASPSAGVIDSQIVKTTEAGGLRGFDAGKKINGRKRHIVNDTEGFLAGAVIHAAERQPGPVSEALCWAHARRKFYELADIAATARRGKAAPPISPLALEAVQRIDALFDVEREIKGLSAEARRCSPTSRPGCARSVRGCPVMRLSPRLWTTCSSVGRACQCRVNTPQKCRPKSPQFR